MRTHLVKFFGICAMSAALLLTHSQVAFAAHHHVFTQQSPSFDATDSNGRFTGQANMSVSAGRATTMAWSFRISPKVQAIATSPMDCRAGHNKLPYSDFHGGVPVDYFWHSTVQGNVIDNTNYTLYGNCTFRVVAGGRPGTANLSFQFHYSLFCGPCGPKPSSEAPARPLDTTSTLSIDYRG
jgi:hypothetical protein